MDDVICLAALDPIRTKPKRANNSLLYGTLDLEEVTKCYIDNGRKKTCEKYRINFPKATLADW